MTSQVPFGINVSCRVNSFVPTEFKRIISKAERGSHTELMWTPGFATAGPFILMRGLNLITRQPLSGQHIL